MLTLLSDLRPINNQPSLVNESKVFQSLLPYQRQLVANVTIICTSKLVPKSHAPPVKCECITELAVESIRTGQGFIEVSESPGLSIELNEKKIEQYTLK